MVTLMPLLEKGDLKLTMPVYTEPEKLATAKPHSVVVFSTIEQEESTVVVIEDETPASTETIAHKIATGAECA